MNRSFIILIFFVIVFIGVTSSIFVVDEREKALVLQFGQVKSVKTDPGIKFKIPFLLVIKYFQACDGITGVGSIICANSLLRKFA